MNDWVKLTIASITTTILNILALTILALFSNFFDQFAKQTDIELLRNDIKHLREDVGRIDTAINTNTKSINGHLTYHAHKP